MNLEKHQIAELSDIESFDPSQYPHSTVLLQLENENDDRLANYLNSFSNFEVVKVGYNDHYGYLVKKYSQVTQRWRAEPQFNRFFRFSKRWDSLSKSTRREIRSSTKFHKEIKMRRF